MYQHEFLSKTYLARVREPQHAHAYEKGCLGTVHVKNANRLV